MATSNPSPAADPATAVGGDVPAIATARVAVGADYSPFIADLQSKLPAEAKRAAAGIQAVIQTELAKLRADIKLNIDTSGAASQLADLVNRLGTVQAQAKQVIASWATMTRGAATQANIPGIPQLNAPAPAPTSRPAPVATAAPAPTAGPITDYASAVGYMTPDKQAQYNRAYQALQAEQVRNRQALMNAGSIGNPAVRSAVEQKLSGEQEALARRMDSVTQAAIKQAQAIKDQTDALKASEKAAKDAADAQAKLDAIQTKFDSDLAAKYTATKQANAAKVAKDQADHEANSFGNRHFPTFTNWAGAVFDSSGQSGKGGNKPGGAKGVSGADADDATAKTKNMGYAVLMLSQATQDMTYSFSAALNNIPGLVLAFGGSSGLAGAIGGASVAADLLYRHWGDLKDVMFSVDTKSVAAKMAELAKQTALTADETRRLSQYEEERANRQTQQQGRTPAHETQKSRVNAAIAEADYDVVKQGVMAIPELRKQVMAGVDTNLETDVDKAKEAKEGYRRYLKDSGSDMNSQGIKEALATMDPAIEAAQKKLDAAVNEAMEKFLAKAAVNEATLNSFTQYVAKNQGKFAPALLPNASQERKDAAGRAGEKFYNALVDAHPNAIAAEKNAAVRSDNLVGGMKDDLLGATLDRLAKGEKITPERNTALAEDVQKRLAAQGVDADEARIAGRRHAVDLTREAMGRAYKRSADEGISPEEAARRESAEIVDQRVAGRYSHLQEGLMNKFAPGQLDVVAKGGSIDRYDPKALREGIEKELPGLKVDPKDVENASKAFSLAVARNLNDAIDKYVNDRGLSGPNARADAARALKKDMEREAKEKKINEYEQGTAENQTPVQDRLNRARANFQQSSAAALPTDITGATVITASGTGNPVGVGGGGAGGGEGGGATVGDAGAGPGPNFTPGAGGPLGTVRPIGKPRKLSKRKARELAAKAKSNARKREQAFGIAARKDANKLMGKAKPKVGPLVIPKNPAADPNAPKSKPAVTGEIQPDGSRQTGFTMSSGLMQFAQRAARSNTSFAPGTPGAKLGELLRPLTGYSESVPSAGSGVKPGATNTGLKSNDEKILTESEKTVAKLGEIAETLKNMASGGKMLFGK